MDPDDREEPLLVLDFVGSCFGESMCGCRDCPCSGCGRRAGLVRGEKRVRGEMP